MKYNIEDLEKKLLSYKLDKNQKEVLKKITDFIEYPLSFDCCLTGKAGTGKTQLMKVLVKILKDNKIPYLVISPTNKSKNVIASITESEAITVHTLLSLYPKLNILDLDFKDLKFESRNSIALDRNAVWIIDECSMINDTLYNLIVKKASEYNCKLLWLGDVSQLAPVKQSTKSKTFDSSLILELTTVYRQQYSQNGELTKLAKLLEQLRISPVTKFTEIIDPAGASLYTYSDVLEFIKNNKCLFQDSVNLEDPTIVKLISYTNKRISIFNKVIRNLIFDHPKSKFCVGDIITGYDTCEVNGGDYTYQIDNSIDYIVTKVEQSTKTICKLLISGWKITLYDTLSEVYLDNIFILDPEQNPPLQIPSLINSLEKLRLDAVKYKSNIKWAFYFTEMKKFLTPIDLSIQGRTIKKKSLDYGYCITVHKSQASQYDTILVDMENILLCPRQKELRQLQYVALSRTQGDIHLYQK